METHVTEKSFDKDGFSFFKEKKNKHIVVGALPGEEVTTIHLGRSGREIYSLVDQIIKKNPHRVKPLCLDVPRCGGCVFQNLNYSQQLEIKTKKIFSLFPDYVDIIKPIIASPCLFQYRGKMDFSFSQDKQGNKYLGLTQAKGSGRVINIQQCQLSPHWMNEILELFRQDFISLDLNAYDRKGEGDLKGLVIREGLSTKERMVILEVVAHPNSQLKKKHIEHFQKRMKEFDSSISFYLRVIQIMKGMPTQNYEMHLQGPESIHERLTVGGKSFKFKISPSAFFQPNPKAAAILFQAVYDIVAKLKAKQVCDLFCGTGTIGMAVSPLVDHVQGVEINPYAIFDAKENAEINLIQNVDFLAQDANKFIEENQKQFDLTIVDPPRSGLGMKACQMLTQLGSNFVLYVSCNPATQAQDVQILKEKGYDIVFIQPLDQFPHTNHVENIILLKKRDG